LEQELQVLELERRYDVRLPDDFRAYLTDCAPSEDTTDSQNSTWWAPGNIRSIPETYEHPVTDGVIAGQTNKFLVFADHMIWSWAWAIACTEDANRGRIAIIDGHSDRFVADSFVEFRERHRTNVSLVA
jgi:hypothetical protein